MVCGQHQKWKSRPVSHKSKQSSIQGICEVVAMKKKQREDKEAKIKEASLKFSPRKAASPLATAVLSGHLSTEKYMSRVISSGSAEKFKPTIPTQKRVRKSASVTELPVASTSTENNTVTADDEELLAITVEFEKSLGKRTETVVMLLKIIALSLMFKFVMLYCCSLCYSQPPMFTSNNRARGKWVTTKCNNFIGTLVHWYRSR